MRTLLLLALLTSPAHAWQADQEGRICRLDHAEPGLSVHLTYDPAGPLYSITVRAPDPWPEAPIFGLWFEGDRHANITTTRHQLGGGGYEITVTDSGFSNVLDGLEFNRTATAFAGHAAVLIQLQGAAAEVAAFRACTESPSA